MSLSIKISDDLKSAMKEKNTVKLGILRVLKAEIQRGEQSANGKVEVTDGDIVKLVKKLIEGIKETTQDATELAVLETYLPQQMTDDEMRGIITLLSVKNLGAIMQYFKANYDGQYNGKQLSIIAKELI